MEEGWHPDSCDGLRSVHKTWGMSQNCPTLSSVAQSTMYQVYMLSWDELSGKRMLNRVETQEEADRLVDECSEMFTHAYIAWEEVPVA